MLCRDVMRRPVHCAKTNDSAESAARRMQDANIGFIPVCDEHDVLVGVLTDRDLALRICAQNRSAAETQVAEILTPTVVRCRAEDDLSRAEELMAQQRISRIVVTDSDGRAEGVISLSDVAMADAPHAAEILREVASRELLDFEGTRQPSSP